MGPKGIVKLLADALNLYPISYAQVQTRSDALGVSRPSFRQLDNALYAAVTVPIRVAVL